MAIGSHALERFVMDVGMGLFGDAEKSDFAGSLRVKEYRQVALDDCVVAVRHQAMHLNYVDVVQA